MKRYTLQFQPLDASVTAADLRGEVDQVLLRLHPRITYKMGEVFQWVDGKWLAMIAADGNRLLIDEVFTNRKWTLPVRFESLNWGWTVENEDVALLAASLTPLDANPLATVQPLDGSPEIRLRSWPTLGRYLSLIFFTLLMIALLIANAIHPSAPLLEGLYIVGFALWMFFLNETTFDFRVYARSFRLLADGLEVSYWLAHRPRKVAWSSISGMDYINPLCKVMSQDGTLRFLISERFGCKDRPAVLKTIVSRAGLRYVEGNFQKLVYRKPGATGNK